MVESGEVEVDQLEQGWPEHLMGNGLLPPVDAQDVLHQIVHQRLEQPSLDLFHFCPCVSGVHACIRTRVLLVVKTTK